MMKNLIVLLVLLLPICLNAQLNRVIYDEQKSQNILYGECNADGFMTNDFKEWFQDAYNSFEITDSLFDNDYLVNFDSVYVFLATWCSDSRREVPAFHKIMDDELFSNVKVRYFALDSHKSTDIIDSQLYKIELVPTFIFYSGGKEIFRITESPETSLEQDIMKYLSQIQN